MKLTVDSGSTKSKWVSDGGSKAMFQGMNPLFSSIKRIEAVFEAASHVFPANLVTAIDFYGAGIVSDEIASPVRDIALRHFPGACFSWGSDILLAARSLFGTSEGIACILGTGSNACYYDGSNIVETVPSGGFILGDEGSGGHIGKLLLSSYLKHNLSSALELEFQKEYPGLDYAAIVKKVYGPDRREVNRYIASFASFAGRHKEDPYILALVSRAFDEFLERNVKYLVDTYKGVGMKMEIGFVGGVAWTFSDILSSCLSQKRWSGLCLGKILREPV